MTAQETYRAAGADIPAGELEAYGNHLFAKGELDRGVIAYSLAGVDVPPEQLIICGEWFNRMRKFDEAVRAFKFAGASKHLVELGDRLLADGETVRLYIALKAYLAAGPDAPNDKLIALGDKFSDRDLGDPAIDAYVAAQAIDRLDAFSSRLSSTGWSVHAKRAREEMRRISHRQQDEQRGAASNSSSPSAGDTSTSPL